MKQSGSKYERGEWERSAASPKGEHTPTPWKSESGYVFSAEDQRLLIAQTNPSDRTDKNGNVVGRDIANAAFIVRAVNEYEANQTKIRVLQRMVEKATGWTLEEISRASGSNNGGTK